MGLQALAVLVCCLNDVLFKPFHKYHWREGFSILLVLIPSCKDGLRLLVFSVLVGLGFLVAWIDFLQSAGPE